MGACVWRAVSERDYFAQVLSSPLNGLDSDRLLCEPHSAFDTCVNGLRCAECLHPACADGFKLGFKSVKRVECFAHFVAPIAIYPQQTQIKGVTDDVGGAFCAG